MHFMFRQFIVAEAALVGNGSCLSAAAAGGQQRGGGQKAERVQCEEDDQEAAH